MRRHAWNCDLSGNRHFDKPSYAGIYRSAMGILMYCSGIYPLFMTNIAMENGPFIDGLPIKNCDFPWLC